jgi:hypothetical protein
MVQTRAALKCKMWVCPKKNQRLIPILNNLAVAENAAVASSLLKLVSDGLVFYQF